MDLTVEGVFATDGVVVLLQASTIMEAKSRFFINLIWVSFDVLQLVLDIGIYKRWSGEGELTILGNYLYEAAKWRFATADSKINGYS